MIIKSYDIVEMATDNLSKILGDNYTELTFNKKLLEKVCDLIDIFIEDNEMNSIEVDANDETLRIVIYVIGPCFQYVKTNNSFMEIAKRALSVSFESQDEDNVKVGFEFDGIWAS